jgi:hypothetical protein
MKKVSGWDPQNRERIQDAVEFEVRGAPFRIDTKYLGNVHVVGKDHPLVLAADIVSNHLYRHLGNLPSNAPLNAPTSIAGWRLEERVWRVSEGASEDLY